MEIKQIIGNIGQDAIIKIINGKEYGAFSVGVNNSYKNSEGVRVESTNWYNVLTRETSRLQWLKKGAKVFVQGRDRSSIYKDKNGVNQISLDIAANIIDIVTFASDKPKDETETAPPATPPVPTPTPDASNPEDDGLPF